jgi:replicative DNA helicase
MSYLSGIPYAKIEAGSLRPDERDSLDEAADNIAKSQLIVEPNQHLTVEGIEARALIEHQRLPLGLILVDYLQYVKASDPKSQRYLQVGHVSKGLRKLGARIKCPVVGLCQVGRSKDLQGGKKVKPPVPTLSDLRESGELEQDGDLIIMLHREFNASPGLFRIAKHRNGPLGDVGLLFHGPTISFSENGASAF